MKREGEGGWAAGLIVNIRQGELETRPDGWAAILLRSFHHIFNPSRLARPCPSAKSTLIPDLLSPSPSYELARQKYYHGSLRISPLPSPSARALIHISTLSDPLDLGSSAPEPTTQLRRTLGSFNRPGR